MLGVNTLLHITSAIALGMLYKQYQDIRLLLETRDDMEQGLSKLPRTTSYISGDLYEDPPAYEGPQGYLEVMEAEGSSVWCHGDHHTSRLCRFRNLCYLPSESHFVFFHSIHSVLEGMPSDRFSPALLDMSSVANHNTQYFNFVDIPASKATEVLQGVQVMSKPALVFKRFNPSNLMHVFHDDLLPMYHTLKLMTLGKASGDPTDKYSVQLVFMDSAELGEFHDLYQMFSPYTVLTRQDFDEADRPVCFRSVLVGISKSPTWYQYGFYEPQGPIPSSNASALDIYSFVQYTKAQLSIDQERASEQTAADHNGNGGLAIILTRRQNRVILNELDLSLALAQRLKMKVVTLSLETHSLKDIVRLLGTASLLMGMHGSLLVLSMFLPPGALVVELFPYAVNPDHYTPYRTLATLPGMWLHYRAWRNMEAAKSHPHPNRSWDLGGITHLSDTEQARIHNSQEVPKHLCCRDPEWLYRIYQDTEVDVEAVVTIAEEHLQGRPAQSPPSPTSHLSPLVKHRLLPSAVTDLSCEDPVTDNPALLTLTFSPPVNLELLDYSSVQYEVWTQEAGTHNISAWILSRTSHTFHTGLTPASQYLVWVRCVLDSQLRGPFNTDPLRCNTS